MIDSAAFRFPFLLLLLALAPASAAQDASKRARELFVANCASCHGETGDGKGTTELDRPARSFQDGGFSFGNTPEALFRTISTGIPGTPMAGFDASLSEEERKLLADYVVTLGPPIEAVADEDMVLAVGDAPVIVRGLLPSLGEGLPSHPRGLLIGDPSGITFEYRVDDVRLLALRQGGFVKRSDWTGRGGTALEPLGKVVHLVEGGKPEACFFAGSAPLGARLSGTRQMPVGAPVLLMDDDPANLAVSRISRPMAALDYHLVRDGHELAHVTEIPHVVASGVGTGYQRDLWVESGARAELVFRTPLVASAEVLARGEAKEERWLVARGADGVPIFVALESANGPIREVGSGRLEASLTLQPGVKNAGVSLTVLVLIDWGDDLRARLVNWWEER